MVWRNSMASTRAALKSLSRVRFGKVGAANLKNAAATEPETTVAVRKPVKTFLLTNLKGTGSGAILSSVTASSRKTLLLKASTDKGLKAVTRTGLLKLGGAGIGLSAATSAAVCKTLTATAVSLPTATAASVSTGIGLKTIALKVASGAWAGLSTTTAVGVKAATTSAVVLKPLVVTGAKTIAAKTVVGLSATTAAGMKAASVSGVALKAIGAKTVVGLSATTAAGMKAASVSGVALKAIGAKSVYGVTVKSLAFTALKGAAGSAIVVGGATVALPAVGFTSSGVAAGSWAALWQSLIGNVGVGSLFASLQSAGVLGFAATTKALFAISGAIVSFFF